MAYYRESSPRHITDWRLYRDNQPATVGTEFAGRDAPKMKFLFTVSFELGPLLRSKNVNLGSDKMAEIQYACKNVTRPNISINYVNVNAYNYRHNVATRTDYGTVNLTLYDDNKNTAHNLVTRYLQAVSPVANMQTDEYPLRNERLQRWASLGPLPVNEYDGLIRYMRVTHHVNINLNDDPDSIRWVRYDYMNPKIQNFAYDDLDMSVSDVNTLSLTMVYDSVRITSNISGGEAVTVTNPSITE